MDMTIYIDILLMDEILHHLGALNYCNSWEFRDLRWCKISSINSIYMVNNIWSSANGDLASGC